MEAIFNFWMQMQKIIGLALKANDNLDAHAKKLLLLRTTLLISCPISIKKVSLISIETEKCDV